MKRPPKKPTAEQKPIAVHCSHDELVPVEQLKPHPKNPNRHPAAQLELLAKVIAGNGWRSPIVVSKRSGFIVSGHGRLEAARILGVETVPVNHQDFASETEELAHLVADNRLAELAEMDNAALATLVEDNLRGKIDLELAGIIEELGQAELKEVKEPVPPAMSWVLIGIPTVKFGDIAAAVEKIAAREDTMVETTVATK